MFNVQQPKPSLKRRHDTFNMCLLPIIDTVKIFQVLIDHNFRLRFSHIAMQLSLLLPAAARRAFYPHTWKRNKELVRTVTKVSVDRELSISTWSRLQTEAEYVMFPGAQNESLRDDA